MANTNNKQNNDKNVPDEEKNVNQEDTQNNAGANANDTDAGNQSEIAQEMAKRIEQLEQKQENSEGGLTKAPTMDVSQFTPEQIQQLRTLLDSTPRRKNQRKIKPVVSLRENEGQLIVDYGDAKERRVFDSVAGRDVEKHVIPVLYYGSDEWETMDYRDFINAPRQEFEVLKENKTEKTRDEGETYDKETDAVVPMEAKWHEYSYVIEIEGEEVEIKAKAIA